ncbi:MAG: Zn-ribbon domain-containing OB-fold protein [Proteobacteria bacterium]|nr:Zn-ribbon domain-containing OB-fold protein [Pseudomonadota bacterium]
MAEDSAATGPLPVVDYLKIPDDGDPYLEGQQCGQCGAIFLGERSVCSKCGTRDQLKPLRLANEGSLYSFSIVHRSFPGIETPYISAIVDLEGGGTVKGNLIGIDPDPEKISFGMPVQVVYKDALGRKDKEGNSYLSYFFQPRG